MFRVDWVDDAVQDLARIWNKTAEFEHDAVRQAVVALDRALQRHAATLGESREADRRIAFVGPIFAEFIVEPRLSLVTVVRLGLSTRP